MLSDFGTLSGSCVSGESPTAFRYIYTYNVAGRVLSKYLQARRILDGVEQDYNVTVNQDYTSSGQILSKIYKGLDPFLSSPPNPPYQFSYSYDSMNRLSGLKEGGPTTWATWVQNVQYDEAGRMTSMQYPEFSSSTLNYVTETHTFNVMGQMTQLTWTQGSSNPSYPSGSIQYTYSATQNNGQITQAVDSVSGETISYQYDSLKRLISASSSPNVGTTPAAWTQSLQYDGFGNLTAKVLNGTATTIGVDSTTNQLSGSSYDANGNMLTGMGNTITYDGSNRIASVTPISGGTEYFLYDGANKPIYHKTGGGQEELTLYGIQGEKLATWTISTGCDDPDDPNTCWFTASQKSATVWFGGRLIWSGTGVSGVNGPVYADRGGSNRTNGARYYPYGEEIGTATTNDHEKFGTYTRSSFTGLDYADQRYYASSYGRFNTADPAPARAPEPATWNRYAYVAGDPINRSDPRGLCIFDESLGTGLDGYDEAYAEEFGYLWIGEGSCQQYMTNGCWLAQYSTCPSGGGGGSDPAPAEPGGGGGGGGSPTVQNQYQASAALANELANLTPHCEDVLPVGQLTQKAGDLSFWDVRINATVPLSAIGAANVQLSNGKFATNIGTAMTLYPSAAAVTLGAVGGGLSNNVVLGSYFFNNESAGDQGITLLHELLHYATQLGDVQFDQKYGITGAPGQSASAALTSWLTNDCHNK